MKTILITGATGLVGSNLVRSEPSCDWLLRPPHEDLKNLLYTYPKMDIIIHAAGYAQPSKFLQDPLGTIEINTTMTAQLLEKLKPGGTFLFCSSVSVYNGYSLPAFEHCIGTTTPQHERSCYIEGKRCGEAIVHAYRQRGVNAMVARLGTTYGPGGKRYEGRAINDFIHQALTLGKITLKDSGTAIRTFCYVDDAVEMLWAVINKGTQEVYNVASPFFYSFKEIAEIIAKKTGAELVIPTTNNGLTGAAQEDYMDTSRMRREFNKYQYMSLENGLAATIAWQKELFGETMTKALITGITGQDGSYLAELLLQKGYEVHGIVRRSSNFNTGRIDHILNDLQLHYGDMTDSGSLYQILEEVHPYEVYNLAAQSHVRTSFDNAEYTSDVDGLGTLRLIQAARATGAVKFYQASTSELFGMTETPQKETTPFYPRSPYAIAKLFGFWTVINYRESYDMFACNGILFNHESSRRSENFVTKKIARGLVDIYLGNTNKIALGNLDARRDWGFAPEFVEAMWLMMQHDEPDDFVIATGESHSVREFLNAGADYLGLDSWEPYVEIDPRYFRPAEVDYLLGDASKAKKVLGWEPKVKFKELVRLMIDHELNIQESV